MSDYDLFVIGAGSGGVRAARIAAAYGARVAIAEESRVGGTCVIRGCVPKKLLTYAAHFAEDFADAAGYGWRLPQAPIFDWASLIAAKDREIDRLNGVYKNLLSGSGVRLYEGRATLLDAHRIAIGEARIQARHILIATGASPQRSDIPGADLAITSNEAFHLPTQPRRILIAGGGYIACEFAGIFNGLGSAVTQLYRGEQILRGFDDDLRHFLAEEMRKKGIDLRLNSPAIAAIEKKGDQLAARLGTGEILDTDAVFYAIGRRPKTAGMGLAEVGVALDPIGAVKVDEYSRSTQPNIYAIGDCTNRLNLTPAAIREGHAFADHVFGGKDAKMDYDRPAMAVFSQPPLASVGLSEGAARDLGHQLDIYKTEFRPMKHTLSGRAEKTLMKLVVARDSGIVLGAHMVGIDAPEIIQAVAIAVKMRATKAAFDATLAIHPTAAEEFVTLRQPVR